MSVELSRLLGAFVLILGCRSERISIGRDRVSDAMSPNPAGAAGHAATGGGSPGAGAAAVQGGAGAGGVPGLVAHWPLDETSGLVAHDSTENHNDGALTSNGVGECAGTATIPLGTWVHLAGTFDGSVVRTFVNGVEECRLVPGELDIPRSLNPVLIGSNQNLAQPGEFMRGTLDEVVLYARALSPEEIGTLVAGGRP